MEPFKEPIVIVMGEDKLINVQLVSQQNFGPFDLTGVTAISTCFLNADASELTLSLGSGITLTSAAAGKILVQLSAAETALLATFNLQTLEISITLSGLVTKVQIPNAYSVVDAVC